MRRPVAVMGRMRSVRRALRQFGSASPWIASARKPVRLLCGEESQMANTVSRAATGSAAAPWRGLWRGGCSPFCLRWVMLGGIGPSLPLEIPCDLRKRRAACAQFRNNYRLVPILILEQPEGRIHIR